MEITVLDAKINKIRKTYAILVKEMEKLEEEVDNIEDFLYEHYVFNDEQEFDLFACEMRETIQEYQDLKDLMNI